MFLPDPASVLRSLSRLLRPGGILAFQEPNWDLFMEASRPFPLWLACASLMKEVFRRSGANANIGPELPQVFQNAELPAPFTRTDILLGADEWMPNILNSLRPQITQFNLATEGLGDMDTLTQRLYAEISAANAKAPLPSLVSAWSRNQ
jgi:SAM-dependent methyltransferase